MDPKYVLGWFLDAHGHWNSRLQYAPRKKPAVIVIACTPYGKPPDGYMPEEA